MKKWTWILIAVVMVGLIGGASVLYNQLAVDYAPVQSVTEAAVDQAPDFTVTDGAGNEVKLSDFFGKPIVLNFWASWCGPCQREMPVFNAKSQELDGNVQFLMINATDGSRETVETASAFVAEQGYTFPVFFDTTFMAAYTYGVYSYPTTFFIDADGYVVTMANGTLRAELLQTGIDMIYKP